MQNYQYPLSSDWTTEEIIRVTTFYNAVEAAYEKGISVEEFNRAYKQFKEIVTSKSEERRIGYQFEDMSGYSIYHTVKEMKRLLTEHEKQTKIQMKQ